MLEENSVNSICTKNTSSVRNEDRGSFTTSPIPPEYINTKRHFFGTPKIEKYDNINNNFNYNSNTNLKSTSNQKNSDINIEQYLDNLNDPEVKDPYYFNNKFIPNKNNTNKLIQMEVSENDIINILEKFNKIAKKMGFEIESSLINCFKEKKNVPITNEMVTFYLKVRYELDDIELQKILLFYSDNRDDPNSEFRIEEFLELIRRFAEDKLKSTKKGNPFENNIYNMNESSYNVNKRSKSPQNKSRYGEDSFRLGKRKCLKFH